MNNSKKIALAVALLCAAGASSAQEMSPVINPSWYIQPGATWIDTDSRFGLDDNEWGLSLKAGKAVHRNWDIQFGVSQVRPEEGLARYRQTLVGADALLMLSRERIRPFLLFGLGFQTDRLDTPLRRFSQTSPYGAVGLGLQATLTPQWSMQADVRAVRGILQDDESFGFDRSINRYVTIGFNYAFNPPPAPPAPPPAPAPVVQPPPPPPEPVAPPPPPAPRFEKVTLSATELFPFDSAVLGMPQPKLDLMAAAIKADPNITDVDVVGYADRIGPVAYNLALSEARANAVRDYLVSQGVDPNQLKAYGKGEGHPVVECGDIEPLAKLIECLQPNRRVEVEQIVIERRVQ